MLFETIQAMSVNHLDSCFFSTVDGFANGLSQTRSKVFMPKSRIQQSSAKTCKTFVIDVTMIMQNTEFLLT